MHETDSPSVPSPKPVLFALGLLLALYLVALMLPATRGYFAPAVAEHEEATADHVEHAAPHVLAVAPFVLLLGCIAVLPLVPGVSHWWENNLHRFYVAGGLAVATLMYYLFRDGAAGVGTTLQHAILGEYIPFIVLLFSLYTICGGIRISGDLPAHPATNTAFILAGGAIASFIGTTGAAMLLVRPLLETNRERKRVAHTVVFFIFVVCNCGGLLTPLGDPPLFLGYLRGVDFLWTMQLWREWLFVNGLLIAVYFCWDAFFAYPREAKVDIQRDETHVRKLKFSGVMPNALLLLGVVLSVAFLDPSKTIPGTSMNAPVYLREAVQLGLVAASLAFGSHPVRKANQFNYGAIVEVAALFVGIFVCMQPALQLLHEHGGRLGVNTPQRFFWATGSLSAVLDNAPTYVVFMEAGKTIPVPEGEAFVSLPGGAQISERFLIAVSLGAVMMGAMTYIGNGPNFMVKAIAEQSGVRMPSFFGYILYSCGVLLPILALMTWIFL
jgi:Na+/H+ antiporter NhaD/arsenite permease-like protein